MQRRSALGRLAITLTGVSLGRVPTLEAAAWRSEPFVVSPANVAESSGLVTCPICHEMADALELTPAGPCLRCADQAPELRVEPHSDRFWILSPEEVRKVESEIEELAAELNRMNQQLVELGQRQLAAGAGEYERAVESKRQEWLGLQRELHLLHLLRAASRQFG
jgi:HAMP domain-containing protein